MLRMIFLKCIKIPIIRKIAWENRDIEAINDIDFNSIYFWLNEKHIETE